MQLKKTLRHPIQSGKRFLTRLVFKFFGMKCIPDSLALKILYKYRMHKKLNFKNPQTFNEKLNWMKLHYRKPEFTDMVNKAKAKNIAASKIGDKHTIKTLALYDKWEDIDFETLPNSFVLKTTHSSGVVFVVRDKSTYDFKIAKKKIKRSLRRNYFYQSREWPYKNCERKIIVEEYMADAKEKNLPVYKFFCFSGKPFIVQTIKNDKTSYETIDYFDMNWTRLELKQNFENSENPLEKPVNFEEMKEIAATLSEGFPFIRVDLYSINGVVYFSEYTFFSDTGFAKFTPDKWDLILGEKIILN